MRLHNDNELLLESAFYIQIKILFSATKIFNKIIYFLNLGLIDSHTHPIWQGDRINEFKMKVSVNFRKILMAFILSINL